MKRKYIFLISFILILGHTVFAQNAPITKAGSVLDASSGTIDIPITVSEFENIGSITLRLEYDPAIVTFESATYNSVFSGMSITNPESGTILFGWYEASSGVTLPDDSQLALLTFTYISGSGSTSLSWNDNGGSCEYADAGLTILNDTPTSEYYLDGYITNHGSPITYAPIITDASGAVDVPVIVDNFTDIGSVSLTLEYDSDLLSYTGNTQNSIFDGNAMVVGDQSSAGSIRKIVISWVGSAETLSDGSSLLTLHFTYSSLGSETVNFSELNWVTDGIACVYADANSDDLYCQPYEEFFIDGLVAGQVAPATYLPVISNAVGGNNFIVPVTVTGFQDIASASVVFEYDATVMTYVGYTQNSIFGMGEILGNEIIGDVGKVSIGYFGAPVTLADHDYIANIEFTFIGGTSELTFTTNGWECEYGDAIFNTLWDNPYEEYYINGVVSSQVAPRIKADTMSAAIGSQISIPVTVWDFNNISTFTLTLDYDPGVLSYVNVTPNVSLGGFFNDGTTNIGRLQMGWFANPPVDLPDETVLLYANFIYNGGTSPLLWYDNGGSCEVTAGLADDILYDQPTEDYYINGLVEGAEYIWVGDYSTDWNASSNWSDNLVPNSLSAVSIPSTPPINWPTYTGDFTLGDQCESIALDVSSELTVTGDMIINPGNAFLNYGSGTLIVGGDWKNSGAFNPGTGEVNFIGDDGHIPTGILPENEIQNYLLSSSPSSMTPIIGTAGPSGDDGTSDVTIGFDFNYAGVIYSEVRISTNGWISLNKTGSGNNSKDNNNLFFSNEPEAAIAPWWDDLMADGISTVSYLYSGGVFTVEWNNMLAYSSGADTRISFQVKLYESTNEIELCYGNVSAGTHNSNEGASIGIKGLVGGANDFIEATTATRNTVISNLSSQTDWPLVNYKFTPPPDTVTFYKLNLDENAILNVETDVNIIGEIQ